MAAHLTQIKTRRVACIFVTRVPPDADLCTMGAGVMVREPPMVGSLFRPLPHLAHLRYHFICLFYTIPMPNIFFCRREMDYLRIPVFWGGCHLLSRPPSLPLRTLKTSKHPRDIIEVRRSELSHSSSGEWRRIKFVTVTCAPDHWWFPDRYPCSHSNGNRQQRPFREIVKEMSDT